MSVFDKNINGSPITAQFLRDIISRRCIQNDTPDEERYERILNALYKKVEYTINRNVYEHSISSETIGVDIPFTDRFVDQVNALIDEGYETYMICEIMKDKLDFVPRVQKFINFFISKGFEMTFSLNKYLDSTNKPYEKVFNIIWK